MFDGCTGQNAELEAIELIQYLPSAVVVPKGTEMRSAENYAAAHPGHTALWGVTARPIPHYGDRAGLVVKETPFDELRRGMTIVYLTQMGVQAGGLLVSKHPAGWRVKDWGADNPKDRYITSADIIGVVVLAFVPPDAASPATTATAAPSP